MFTSEEKELLLMCISNEQIRMIIKDHTMHEDDDYKKLEELKVKIKDIKSPMGMFIVDLEPLFPNLDVVDRQ